MHWVSVNEFDSLKLHYFLYIFYFLSFRIVCVFQQLSASCFYVYHMYKVSTHSLSLPLPFFFSPFQHIHECTKEKKNARSVVILALLSYLGFLERSITRTIMRKPTIIKPIILLVIPLNLPPPLSILCLMISFQCLITVFYPPPKTKITNNENYHLLSLLLVIPLSLFVFVI